MGEVSIRFSPSGKMVVEGHHLDSSFTSFLYRMGETELAKRSESSQHSPLPGEGNTREKAQRGAFAVNKRKDKFHFSFGFAVNNYFRLSELLHRFCPSNRPNMTEEERIQAVLESRPEIYEDGVTSDGERIFCYPRQHPKKGMWDWELTNNRISVFKPRGATA
jgi:hypothetical protein